MDLDRKIEREEKREREEREICAELVFWQVSESQSVELLCPIPEQSSLSHLHLYHRDIQSQSTLLSLSWGDSPRVSPKHRVNVTLENLESGDTGLYMWEMTENNSSERSVCEQKIFLWVESSEKQCTCSSLYPRLLFTICAAAGLILFIICGLGLAQCVKSNQHRTPRPSAPIYVEMSRKEQTLSQNISERASHLEEAPFPVYANPNYRQLQDNYYACPRQLKMEQ
ncbi:hypothetical protein WMY93_003600 [Mugilogobius chulae]|uniref:Uncharacterized protein n=1 Tax=Mugilogobius chulae TaxID=88201 RepID=A0AAW0Q7Y9_9GOBI